MKKGSKFFRSEVFIASFLPLDTLRRNMQKKNFRCRKSPKSQKFFLCIDNAASAATATIWQRRQQYGGGGGSAAMATAMAEWRWWRQRGGSGGGSAVS
jgi:hypothetical protein